jgi:hypothetical protein
LTSTKKRFRVQGWGFGGWVLKARLLFAVAAHRHCPLTLSLSPLAEDPIYRVTFVNQGEIYEIFARHVGQGGLFGFVEVEELLFGERSKILIDSSEDRLKTEFDGVKRTYIPLHSVVRIDEVDKAGRGRISSTGDTVANFPLTYVPQSKPSSELRVDRFSPQGWP